MQREEIIDMNKFYELIKFIFLDSKAVIYESYSKMEQEILSFNSFSKFQDYFEYLILEGEKHLSFGIYYPDSKGKALVTQIKLDHKRCKGKTYRYRIDGWGLIFINLSLLNIESRIKCNISCSSKKRAESWESINPKLGSPEQWDWDYIESNTRKIIYRMRK